MYWTTLLPLLPLVAKASDTTRILTKFTPNCPSEPHHTDLNEEFTVALNVRDGICQGVPVPMPLGYFDEVDHVSVKLEIDEGHGIESGTEEKEPSYAVSASLSISSPSSTPTLTHTSTTTSTSSHSVEAIQWKGDKNRKRSPNLEVCILRLYETPGCYGFPLIQREFGVGAGVGGESRCVTRSPTYMGLGEMFVKLDCVDGSLPHVCPSLEHGVGGKNGTHANATANGGVHHGGANGIKVAGKWQGRRLALLGR
ncbi:uncharacterized protein BDV17DRAFT_285906 [Aspergillus undulatus]|uniref:uncharacterized protein n=1 Tax=Aspergillus undulatus TaxID=1810928 RepID=UPI003CCD63FC